MPPSTKTSNTASALSGPDCGLALTLLSFFIPITIELLAFVAIGNPFTGELTPVTQFWVGTSPKEEYVFSFVKDQF